MSPELALSLVHRLVAAFPVPRWGDDTVEFYAGELEGYLFEPANDAITHITRSHIARPSMAVMRDEIQKRMPNRKALSGPDDWVRLDVDEPLETPSFALSRKQHPGQGDTPATVVRTSAEERRLLDAVYRQQREAYRLWVSSHTPEERAALQREFYRNWRAGKQRQRSSEAS